MIIHYYRYLLFCLVLLPTRLSAQLDSIVIEQIYALYAGIPVFTGVDLIVASEDRDFVHTRSVYPDGHYDNWVDSTYQYVHSIAAPSKTILAVGQTSNEARYNCYFIDMRLFYESEELAGEEMFHAKEVFEDLEN